MLEDTCLMHSDFWGKVGFLTRQCSNAFAKKYKWMTWALAYVCHEMASLQLWSKLHWNFWGVMVQMVYHNECQYQNTKVIMFSSWNQLSMEQLEKLFQSVPSCIFKIAHKNGIPTYFWMCALILSTKIQIC